MTDLFDSESEQDSVEALAEEFLNRRRQGETPSLTEYTQRHPDLADEIRDVFPALLALEEARPTSDAVLSPVESCSEELAILSRIGDYRIVREVGRGGMGVVYEAEQVSLGRRVALKILPAQLLADTKQRRRFEREARAAARLHHTNIVPVFGVGEHNGMHYYAMQFIHGLGLDEVLTELQGMREPTSAGQGNGTERRTSQQTARSPIDSRQQHQAVLAGGVAQSLMSGRFDRTLIVNELEGDSSINDGCPSVASGSGVDLRDPLHDTAEGRQSETNAGSKDFALPGQSQGDTRSSSQAVYWQSVARIGVQAAEALQHAHDQGIIHRDVKPANLLLDTCGTVWVTDFGLAKATDQQDLTQTGDLLGTLRYMAPEQLEGTADARSDIYALGLTLYELLAMKPAFDERERNRLIKQVAAGTPLKLRIIDPHIPRDLETIVHKALDREPGSRYQAAGELANDLKRYLGDEPIRARRISPAARFGRWCRRNPALATLSSAVVLLLAVTSVVSIVAYQQTSAALLQAEQNAEEARQNARTAETARQKAEEARQAETAQRRDAETQRDRALKAEQQAEAERRRAETNFRRARQAVDEMYTQVAEKWLAHQPRLEPLQREFLIKASSYYEEFAEESSTDPTVRFETAQASRRVAEIQAKLGHLAQAEPPMRRAIEQLQKLVDEFPAVPAYRQALASALYRMVEGIKDLGRPDEAEKLGRHALAIQEKLVAEFPSVAEYRRDLARSRCTLGRMIGSTALLREASDIQKKLVAEFPAVPEYREDLAETYGRLGQNREASAILEQLVAEYPTVPQYRNELAYAYTFTAKQLVPGLQEKETILEKALPLQRKLVDDFPSVADYRYDLARTLSLMSTCAQQTKRYKVAEDLLREAVPIADKLAADSPEVDYYRLKQAEIDGELAELLQLTGRLPEAEAIRRKQVALSEKYRADFPNKLAYFPVIESQAYHGLAALLAATGRREEAIGLFRQVINDLEKRAAEHPGDKNERLHLAKWHVWLAALFSLLEDQKHADEEFNQARALAGDNAWDLNVISWELLTSVSLPEIPKFEVEVAKWGVKLAERAVELDPSNGSIWDTVGILRYRAGKWQEAITALKLSNDLSLGFVQYNMLFVAMSYRQLGQKELAEKWYAAARLVEGGEDRFHAEAATLFQPTSQESSPTESRNNERYYTRLVELDPQCGWAYYLRAQIYRERKETDKADADLREAFKQYTHLVEAKPDEAPLRLTLSGLCCKQGLWDQAEPHLARATQLLKGNYRPWYELALVRLAAGKKEAYRAAAVEMLQQFSATEDPETEDFTAWTCSLSSDAVTDFAPAVALAEKAAQKDSQSAQKMTSLGAILYRAGRCKDAVQRLEQAEQLGQKSDDASRVAYPQFFLAMGHHRLGNEGEARKWFDQARNRTEKILADADTGAVKITWNRRLTLILLRKEAEALWGAELKP